MELKGPTAKRKKILGVPVNPEENAKLAEGAKREGMPLASWLRRLALLEVEANQRKTA